MDGRRMKNDIQCPIQKVLPYRALLHLLLSIRMPSKRRTVVNPRTHRSVKVGGKTYMRMKLPSRLFCGSKPRTFPVYDLAHARDALSRAHFDRNPAKVKACAYRRIAVLKRSMSTKTKRKVKRSVKTSKRVSKKRTTKRVSKKRTTKK